jgi:endonuclease/exonuclease/phosphatase family metal-dependent hydrolase
MPLLVLVLAALLGLGFVWLLFAVARAVPPYRVDGDTIVLRHGQLLRAFAVLAFFGAPMVFGLWILFFPPRSNATLAPIVVAAALLGLAGFLLVWEAFKFQLTVSPAGLDCRSPWKGRFSQTWDQVTALEYSSANAWFTLKFQGGGAFHVSALVPGVSRFLEACEGRLKPEQLANAEPGYRKLGRKWPFGPVPPKPNSFRLPRWLKRFAALLLVLGLVPLLLFVVNGTLLASGETPIVGSVADGEAAEPHGTDGEVRIVAYNIAKGFAHHGGLKFTSKADVEARLKKMAAVIRAERPDFVFLSEAMTECGPADMNQVEFLARACGLPHFAFGENYNFGLPFFRVVGGNAILAREPLTAVANLSLAGRQPFYVTRNNRRALFASVERNGKPILLGSLHNDSFDIANNGAQVRQLLEFIGDRPCVLAGDFNVKPNDEPIRLLKASRRFEGLFDGPPTFPEKSIRIDYVFAPKAWKHLETKVIPNDASDHYPVSARFGFAKERKE